MFWDKKKKTKKEHVEEDITIYDENDSIARSRQKSRRVFVFYIVALFSLALVIILASYVLQAHQQKQLETMDKRLNEQVDITAGAQNRAEQMQNQLDKLQKKLKKTQDELDSTKEELDAAKDKLQKNKDELKTAQQEVKALNELWKLEELYKNGSYDEAEELIDQMDEAYTRAVLTNSEKSPLTGEAATEYYDICTALGV